jgi:gluconate 2-dehydrogenase subunit 3-like protein
MTAIRRRFPDYDVLANRNTPSWNEQTRRIVDERLQIRDEPQFFTEDEWLTLRAVCSRIVPQPPGRERPIPVAAMIDRKLHQGKDDGYRLAEMPPMQQAWRQGLAALDEEAKLRFGACFHELLPGRQDSVLSLVQQGEVRAKGWRRLPAQKFFMKRVQHDAVSAYYAHPTAWNEIGFGGPASPRGYVRMDFNRRDPWEAKEREDALQR